MQYVAKITALGSSSMPSCSDQIQSNPEKNKACVALRRVVRLQGQNAVRSAINRRIWDLLNDAREVQSAYSVYSLQMNSWYHIEALVANCTYSSWSHSTKYRIPINHIRRCRSMVTVGKCRVQVIFVDPFTAATLYRVARLYRVIAGYINGQRYSFCVTSMYIKASAFSIL